MRDIVKFTLLEALRSRLYLVSLAAVLGIAALGRCGAQINDLFGNLTPATLAFGMFFTKAVGWVFLLAAPVFNLAAEIESGSIQFVLARAVRRETYLLAKYLAYLILYAILLLLATAALAVVTLLVGRADPAAVARGLGLFLFSELAGGALLLAIVFTLYAAIRAPVAAATLSAMAFFVSLMLDTARTLANTAPQPLVRGFYLLLYYAYPGFRFFNLEKPIVYQQPVAPAYLAMLALYAAVTTGVLLAFACRLFRRREL